jgi:hypothetical protein
VWLWRLQHHASTASMVQRRRCQVDSVPITFRLCYFNWQFQVSRHMSLIVSMACLCRSMLLRQNRQNAARTREVCCNGVSFY